MNAGLQVTGIAKRYGATIALDGVDLAVRPGEVVALLGENGAGKSTLMNVLSGEVQPDRGEMRLDGQPFAPSAPSDARRRGVALIHQELSLCPHLSVTDNVLLGNEVSHRGFIDRAAARAQKQQSNQRGCIKKGTGEVPFFVSDRMASDTGIHARIAEAERHEHLGKPLVQIDFRSRNTSR